MADRSTPGAGPVASRGQEEEEADEEGHRAVPCAGGGACRNRQFRPSASDRGYPVSCSKASDAYTTGQSGCRKSHMMSAQEASTAPIEITGFGRVFTRLCRYEGNALAESDWKFSQ